jgi:hypothetical protein
MDWAGFFNVLLVWLKTYTQLQALPGSPKFICFRTSPLLVVAYTSAAVRLSNTELVRALVIVKHEVFRHTIINSSELASP